MRASLTAALMLIGGTASARADQTIGVAVAGDADLAAPVSASISDWLGHHGQRVATPLSRDRVAALTDCFVIEADNCARAVIAQHDSTAAFLFVGIQVTAASSGREVTLVVHWLVKDRPTITRSGSCGACGEPELRQQVDKMLLALVGASASAVAVAPTPNASLAVVRPVVVADTTPKRWHAGLDVGVEVPRSDLDPGVLVGAIGTYALDHNGTWLARASVDWVETGRHSSALLTPTPFPRSRTELDEQTDLVTFGAGASVRLAKLTKIELRAGLSAGIQIARTRFDAYTTSQVERSIGPAAMVEVSVGSRLGPIQWRAVAGWREARRDLGTAGTYGNEVTSGAIVALGADW